MAATAAAASIRLIMLAAALLASSAAASAAPACSPGVDFEGAALAGFPLQLPPGGTAAHCEVMCRADPRCASYSFYAPGCTVAN